MITMAQQHETLLNIMAGANKRVMKFADKHPIGYDESIYNLSKEIFYLYESMAYLVELDQADTETYADLNRRYKRLNRQLLHELKCINEGSSPYKWRCVMTGEIVYTFRDVLKTMWNDVRHGLFIIRWKYNKKGW